MKNCKECHKQYSQMNKNAEGGCTPPVLQINNPSEVTLFHKVVVPTSMGDDTAFPPEVGLYKNVLLYYEVNQKTYLYSSDGIPTLLVNGVTDYEQAINLPQINSNTLIGDKTGAELGLQNELTAGANIQIDSDNVISATDTTYGPATDESIGLVKPGDGLSVQTDGTLDITDIEEYAHFFDTVADMQSAENLTIGSKAKTYGYLRQGDGVYNLYVVREILNTDVVDGYNIVALANTEDLVAVRLQDGKQVAIELESGDNLQDYLDLKADKLIKLPANTSVTVTSKLFINSDTILDLNNSTLVCDYDSTETLVFMYGLTDTFTGYNGYKNITIRNGSFSGGCICMMHNKNVTIENVEFLTPNSRHALQIAGSYGVTIKNCIFNGTRSDYADSDEAINIDPCNYAAQPFMDQASVMYDHTANKNITIEGNTFNTTNETGFRHTCCMGSHGADDENQTIAIGVTIRDNDFGSPYTTCVNTRDWKDVVIENNVGKFATSGVNTQTYGICVRGSLENASVVDNTITNPTTFFYTSGQTGDTKKNINIQGNTVKTLDDTDYQCIHIMATTDCNIRDNILYYKENCIYTNAVSGVYCERVNIINNFISKTSSTSNQGIRIKGSSYVTINDNDFAYVGLTSEAGYAIDVTTNADATQIEICNNKTKFPRRFMTNDSYQDCVYCRNNSVLYSNASSFSAGTLSGNGTFNKVLTFFSKIYLQFGDSSDQLVVELQPWFNATKFDTSSRTWKGTVVASDGTVGTYVFNVTNSSTKFSFTTSLGLRYIYVSD